MAEVIKELAKTKTAAELRKEYDALAAECTRLAAERPKAIKAFATEVKKRLGDFDAKLQAKIKAKGIAAIELRKAEEAAKSVSVN